MLSVNIECDPAPFLGALDLLSAELPNLSGEVRSRLLDLLEGAGELVRFQTSSTLGALKLTLYPSDLLLEFVAASGAR